MLLWLPLATWRFPLPWFWSAKDRVVLSSISWQSRFPLFALRHFFLLDRGLRLDMKWAGVPRSFGPTLLYPWNVESFQREFWEINPRKQQDWFIYNLILLILQIPLLPPSPLSYPWEDLKSNSYLITFRAMRRLLVFGMQFKKEPNHFGWRNGLIAVSRKLEKTRLGITLLEQETWKA